jgi:hypothetical protein
MATEAEEAWLRNTTATLDTEGLSNFLSIIGAGSKAASTAETLIEKGYDTLALLFAASEVDLLDAQVNRPVVRLVLNYSQPSFRSMSDEKWKTVPSPQIPSKPTVAGDFLDVQLLNKAGLVSEGENELLFCRADTLRLWEELSAWSSPTEVARSVVGLVRGPPGTGTWNCMVACLDRPVGRLCSHTILVSMEQARARPLLRGCNFWFLQRENL